MRAEVARRAIGLVAVALAAVALVWIGRATVHTSPPASETARSDAYLAGVRAGEAEGKQEGRALQEGASLPKASRQPVTDAFNAGYADGMNDAFAGGDGGWDLSVPYVITVEKGSGKIVYRISSHTPFEAKVNYYLCPDGHHVCQEPRR
jgi:hypothetical protein